jgi:hypothetical protein
LTLVDISIGRGVLRFPGHSNERVGNMAVLTVARHRPRTLFPARWNLYRRSDLKRKLM